MEAPSTMNWNTVVMDLQRSVNNLALYVLESMAPPTWLATFLDVNQPPPGYGSMSHASSEANEKPPPKNRPGPGRKKKTPETH